MLGERNVEEATEVCEVDERGRAIPEKHRERDRETEGWWRAGRGRVGGREEEEEEKRQETLKRRARERR